MRYMRTLRESAMQLRSYLATKLRSYVAFLTQGLAEGPAGVCTLSTRVAVMQLQVITNHSESSYMNVQITL